MLREVAEVSPAAAIRDEEAEKQGVFRGRIDIH
jgi:hypothetical protein